MFFYDKINTMTDKKQIIVMMGGPGVGKGTFSHMLMNTHTYDHIEAGALLRAEPADSEIYKLISFISTYKSRQIKAPEGALLKENIYFYLI